MGVGRLNDYGALIATILTYFFLFINMPNIGEFISLKLNPIYFISYTNLKALII